MAKFIELQCCECETKQKFVDVKDITFQKWRIIAWNVSASLPIVACSKCVLPWERSNSTRNLSTDKEGTEPVDDKRQGGDNKENSENSRKKRVKTKSKKSNEKKRIQKRSK